MKVLLLRITLRANFVHSLKEKRMIIRSLTQKLKNKFNISVSEVDSQDVHQNIVIGICGIFNTSALINSSLEKIITFIECSTDAEIIDIEHDEDIF